jgi:hypothetical protein
MDRAGYLGDDLGRRGTAMRFRVGGVLELVRHPISVLGDQCLSHSNCASHTLLARGKHQFCAKGLEQLSPLDAHRIGHNQDDTVPFGRADHSQANAGIAAGRFDDRPSRS